MTDKELEALMTQKLKKAMELQNSVLALEAKAIQLEQAYRTAKHYTTKYRVLIQVAKVLGNLTILTGKAYFLIQKQEE